MQAILLNFNYSHHIEGYAPIAQEQGATKATHE
jgi:hypothetical protein